MEIFFNELSNEPPVENNSCAKNQIISILNTLKRLREDGFNVMRAHENFYSLQLSQNYTFCSFINDPDIKQDLKILLKGIVKSPYIKSEHTEEEEKFILGKFKVKDEHGIDLSPEGLAAAYIYKCPVISLSGNVHWEKEKIPLNILQENDIVKEKTHDIINVYSVESVEREYFRKWLKLSNHEEIQLSSPENIAKVFPQDKFIFEQRAIDDLLSCCDDMSFTIRIKELINDIPINPFNGGIGHTEVLKGLGGKASKRITKQHRIVYTFNNKQVIIHQCRGHYDD